MAVVNEKNSKGSPMGIDLRSSVHQEHALYYIHTAPFFTTASKYALQVLEVTEQSFRNVK